MDLKSLLFPALRQLLLQLIENRSIKDLDARAEFRQEVELAIAKGLAQTFAGSGVAFGRIKTLAYRHERLDRVRGVREDLFLGLTEEEAKLEHRQRFFDSVNENELEDIRQTDAGYVTQSRKVEQLDELQKLANSKEMSQVGNADDLDRFLFRKDADMRIFKATESLMGDDRIAEMRALVGERSVKREENLKHIGKVLQIEHDLEETRLRRMGDLRLGHEETAAQTDHDLLDKEKRLDAALEDGRKRLDAELAADRDRAATARGIQAAEHEQDVKEAEDAIKLREKAQAASRTHEEETRTISRKDDLARAEAAARLEKEKLETLSNASAEALIVMAGPDRAEMLAELQKTEAMRGMTEEQILAMGAEKSPHVAAAFKEKFRGMNQEELGAMYEKMLEAQRGSAETLAKTHADYARMLQQMFEKGMDAQQGTAIAAARGQPATVAYPPAGAAPTVIGPGGQAVVAPGGGEKKVVVCRHCRAEMAADAAFCTNCGKQVHE
jgi:hypothetical protein